MNAEQEKTAEQSKTVNDIWRLHAALDTVYGKGYAKDHPDTVARFMQALSTEQLALEVSALREIISNGSGAFTVGLEHA